MFSSDYIHITRAANFNLAQAPLYFQGGIEQEDEHEVRLHGSVAFPALGQRLTWEICVQAWVLENFEFRKALTDHFQRMDIQFNIEQIIRLGISQGDGNAELTETMTELAEREIHYALNGHPFDSEVLLETTP